MLGHVLDQLLRLLHPVIPFVTEELWTALTGGETVMTAAWPVADRTPMDDAAEREVGTVQRVVTEIRRFRSDQGLRPTQRVAARLDGLGGAARRARAADPFAGPAGRPGRRLPRQRHPRHAR